RSQSTGGEQDLGPLPALVVVVYDLHTHTVALRLGDRRPECQQVRAVRSRGRSGVPSQVNGEHTSIFTGRRHGVAWTIDERLSVAENGDQEDATEQRSLVNEVWHWGVIAIEVLSMQTWWTLGSKVTFLR
ncbi:hypothetical protein PC117_g26584, partial [Phytophthora cactorum]